MAYLSNPFRLEYFEEAKNLTPHTHTLIPSHPGKKNEPIKGYKLAAVTEGKENRGSLRHTALLRAMVEVPVFVSQINPSSFVWGPQGTLTRPASSTSQRQAHAN